MTGKQLLSWSEDRTMCVHPPADFLRSKLVERSKVRLWVYWHPASVVSRIPRFLVRPTVAQQCTFDHDSSSMDIYCNKTLLFLITTSIILVPSSDHDVHEYKNMSQRRVGQKIRDLKTLQVRVHISLHFCLSISPLSPANCRHLTYAETSVSLRCWQNSVVCVITNRVRNVTIILNPVIANTLRQCWKHGNGSAPYQGCAKPVSYYITWNILLFLYRP